jgi:DNA-binding NarL/FixJ family response regulator
MNKVRVLVADDHPVVRDGLRGLIDSQPDMETVGEAADGEEGFQAAATLLPDVVVMDISMPKLSGTQATAKINRECPGTKVIILTAHEERGYIKQSLQMGAAGYVLKRSAADNLVRAIRSAMAGETYLDPAVAGQVVAEVSANPASTTVALSERENEVLRLVAQGFLIKQIAGRLDVEVRTVETYKSRAMEKLGLKTRVDIVRYASQRGWLIDG